MINSFFLQGKTKVSDYDWWLGGGLVPESTTYTVFDAIDAADQASSYVNLANPGTRDATDGVAPGWSSTTGWTFNGTTQYIIATGTKFLANSTLIIWYEDWGNVYVVGSTKLLIRPRNAGVTRLTITTNLDTNGESTGGIIGVRAELQAYRNNIKVGTMGAWSAGTDYDLYLGCRNSAGSAANFGSGKIYRMAHYDFKLSDAQMEAVIAAMYNYQTPGADPYEATVMSLNPICYYPMTQKYGSALYDISGNNAPSQIHGLPVGQSGGGGKGLSVAGDGTTNNFITTYQDWATLTGINMDEFSATCWIKVQSDATNQIRVFNIYSDSGNEYAAVEIRSGLSVEVFLKANGATQSGATINLTNNTWAHIVFYNSQTDLEYGVYINGVKYTFTRTVGTYVDDSPDFSYPFHMQDMLGNMNHLAYFNHALTQGEVDTLYV